MMLSDKDIRIMSHDFNIIILTKIHGPKGNLLF